MHLYSEMRGGTRWFRGGQKKSRRDFVRNTEKPRRAYGNFNFPELLPGETLEDAESMLAAKYRLANYLIGIAVVISRPGQDEGTT